MDPFDFLILSGAAGGLMVISGARYRRSVGDGQRRPGAQIAAVGTTLGHIAGRSAALSGRAVGMGIEAAAAATAWPTGVLIDGSLGILDGASRTVAGLTALVGASSPAGVPDATDAPSS